MGKAEEGFLLKEKSNHKQNIVTFDRSGKTD